MVGLVTVQDSFVVISGTVCGGGGGGGLSLSLLPGIHVQWCRDNLVSSMYVTSSTGPEHPGDHSRMAK